MNANTNTPQCGDCRHYRKHPTEIRPMGMCFKNPPVPVLVMTPQGPGQQNLIPIVPFDGEFGCFEGGKKPVLSIAS